MKIKQTKKVIKAAKAKVANIALGYVAGATYRDLYNAIGDAEFVLRQITGRKSPKVVLMAHVGLEQMHEVRTWAHQGKI